MTDVVATKTPEECQQTLSERFKRLWSVQLNDFGRGLVIAVLAVPLDVIYQTVTATPMVLKFDWKSMLGSAIAGGVAYIIKALGTGSGGKLLTNK